MLKNNYISAIWCVYTVFSLLCQGCSKPDSNQEKIELSPKIEKVEIDSALSTILPDSVERLSAKSITSQRFQLSPSNKVEKPLQTVGAPNQQPSNQTMGISSVYDCGSYLSGNHYTTGFYRYPDQLIDLRTPVGKVTISLQSYDVPNRFDVYDDEGKLVISSGWMGYATYPGPWGSSLNTSQSKSLIFTKTKPTYSLRIETVIQNNSDSWNASISCSAPPTTTSTLESYFLGYDKTILASPDSVTRTRYMIQKNPGLITYLNSQYPTTFVPSQMSVDSQVVTFAAIIHMYAQALGKLPGGSNTTSFLPFEDINSREILKMRPSGFSLSMVGISTLIDNTYNNRNYIYFRMDWGCVKDIVFGLFDIASLVEDYVSLLRGGGSWSTVRGLLWRTAKRYAGWAAAAGLIYDITTECI